jgi:hypothetical protein
MIITAHNKKHQGIVNKAVQWLEKHNAFNDQRDRIEDNLEGYPDEDTAWRRINKKCEDSFGEFEFYMDELPKREQDQITKSELY